MLVTIRRVPRPNVEERVELASNGTSADALRKLAIPLDAVIVLRGETPIPLDAPLAEGDRLKVIAVFSGG